MYEERVGNADGDMIYLTACALHGVRPDAVRISEMDLQALYDAAMRHMMTVVVYTALEEGAAFKNAAPEIVKKWKDAKNKAIRKNMLLEEESQRIFDFMEGQGIWYMPLKGSVLKQLYPGYGMRQMSDVDILFDSSYQLVIKKYMTGRGYETEMFGKGSHDVYKKTPVYNFEMHRLLFGKWCDPVWVMYYSKVKDRLKKDADNLCGYHFSDEDFYVYFITHAYKHYDGYGTGLRSLMDCYVYLSKKEDSLDWSYIQTELEGLKIAEFEKQCRFLSKKLFCNAALENVEYLTEKERKQAAEFLETGVYGSCQKRVEKGMKEILVRGEMSGLKSRWKYYLHRLFPDMEWYQVNEPFCFRHRWFIPFFCFYRVLRGMTVRRKMLIQEIRIVRRIRRKKN